MNATADFHPRRASESPAARYRRALETAAWSRAEFAHPVHAHARGFTARGAAPSSPNVDSSAPRAYARALALNGLAMCASFVLVALGVLR